MPPNKPQKPKVRIKSDNFNLKGSSNSTPSTEIDDLWNQLDSSNMPDKPLKQEISDATKSIKKSIKQTTKKTSQYASVQQTTEGRSLVVKLPKKQKKYSKNKLPKIIIISVVATILVGIGAWIYFQAIDKQQTAESNNNQQTSKPVVETNVTPDFPVLTPFGAGVADLGGFANISPDGAPPVYTFTDSISGVPIKVSQQLIPDAFRSDRDAKLKDLATQFNANEQILVDENPAYIGTSEDGVQSVVYIKGENLVLIASDNIISNADWLKYLGNLKY
jgi:hypothetical protein